MVKMSGDDKLLVVPIIAIVGIEWNEEYTTRFRLENIHRSM